MKIKLISFFVFGFFVLNAQTAPAYYNPVDFELTGNDLKMELTSLMNSTHNNILDYSDVWDVLKSSDLNPNNSSNVWLFYGWDDNNSEDDDDLNRYKHDTCGGGNPCTDETWNREHVFPKALDLSDSDDEGPTADPHMLRSTDVEMNGARGNRAFEDGSGIASYFPSGSGFFPGENWRGDVARIIMYMYVHYGSDWNANLTAISGNNYHPDMPNIFLEWNAEDPASDYELNRNNVIQAAQGNRNPFIDNPYLATVIWGGPEAENTWPQTLSVNNIESGNKKLEIYPNPVEYHLNFSSQEMPKSIKIFSVKGKLVKIFESPTSNSLYLNMEKGVYYVEFQFENRKELKKIIKK